jgi:hypothetical protein
MFNLASSRHWIMASIVAGGMVAGGGAQAQQQPKITVYNVFSQFSSTNNPNGPWSYIYSNSNLLTQHNPGLPNGASGWWDGQNVPDSVDLYKNNTTAPIWLGTPSHGVLVTTNELDLDPESLSVEVQFAAPSSSYYRITGKFVGHDNGTGGSVPPHPVKILDNGAVIYSSTISAFFQIASFDLTEQLAAGDKITFWVGTGTGGGCSYCYLTTGLQAILRDHADVLD